MLNYILFSPFLDCIFNEIKHIVKCNIVCVSDGEVYVISNDLYNRKIISDKLVEKPNRINVDTLSGASCCHI